MPSLVGIALILNQILAVKMSISFNFSAHVPHGPSSSVCALVRSLCENALTDQTVLYLHCTMYMLNLVGITLILKKMWPHKMSLSFILLAGVIFSVYEMPYFSTLGGQKWLKCHYFSYHTHMLSTRSDYVAIYSEMKNPNFGTGMTWLAAGRHFLGFLPGPSQVIRRPLHCSFSIFLHIYWIILYIEHMACTTNINLLVPGPWVLWYSNVLCGWSYGLSTGNWTARDGS